MNKHKTVSEWEMELGKQVRDLRLRLNIDQRNLAARAGIALNAVKNLESGRGATISTLIKVLRILDRIDWLTKLAPEVSVSPIQMLTLKHPRQRASGSRKSHV